MKILAIGNSFSDDARTYVAQIARAGGAQVTIGNLYIGGCSLERHAKNARTDAAEYAYSKTDAPDRMASIREALEEEKWDFITLQQVSQLSGYYESYQPYLGELAEYVARLAPDAEQLIHQTWAYELDSAHPGFAAYHHNQREMYEALKVAYAQAADSLNARIIPSGDAMQIARAHPLFDCERGGKSLCRDGFHASLTHGRYLLGLTWVAFMTGMDITQNPMRPELPDHPELTPTDDELCALRRAAHAAVRARN